MRTATRDRGVFVKVLDLTALEAQALAYRQQTHPDCYAAKIYGGKIAIGRSKTTEHMYSICTEGVGPDNGVTDDDPLLIEFHGSYHMRDDLGDIIPNTHTFDFLSFASTTLNPHELLEYPVEEEIDLADFVRSFGSRLEMNFWMWHDILN